MAAEDYIKNKKEQWSKEDLSQLTHMEMGNVLDNLEHRWLHMGDKQIYTSLSNILIAVNPYERVAHLDRAENLEKYYNQEVQGKVNSGPPHPFSVGARSHFRLIHGRANAEGVVPNQSVVVCGESGAGKTESTKRVIEYLAKTSGGSGTEISEISDKILEASPILETFGNAKTTWNNNSSRFGRFTKLLYEVKAGGENRILGAAIERYLLEKSRVVAQGKKERNYHSFYVMATGQDSAWLEEYGVTDITQFAYAAGGNTFTAPGIDDLEDYGNLLKSFEANNFQQSAVDDIFRILAGILHLGNITFQPDDEQFTVICAEADESVKFAAHAFGVKEDGLRKILTKEVKKKFTKNIQFRRAGANRDSIAKNVYSNLFDHLVNGINAELSGEETAKGDEHLRFIGVLDVFGFENFAKNSLEQLCINFTNERLQDFFNHSIILGEIEEYNRESVFFEGAEPPDSKPMIELVTAKGTGLFSCLDDACKGVGDDDAAKLTVMCTKFYEKNKNAMKKGDDGVPLLARAQGDGKKKKGGRARARSRKSVKGGQKEYFGATLKHYAGCVTYNFGDFIVKNTEKASMDTKKLLKKSNVSLLAKIMSKKTAKGNLATKFNKQLVSLITTLKITDPYFVRCVNPNREKSSKVFSRECVEFQLQAGGVIEALAVLATGYPTRIPYKDLRSAFPSLDNDELLSGLDDRKFANCLLRGFEVNDEYYVYGITKVFFKPAKAEALYKIQDCGGVITPEQRQRMIEFLSQVRIDQLFGALKVGLKFKADVRDMRAHDRWQAVSRTLRCASELVNYLHKARAEIERRNKENASKLILSYYRAFQSRKKVRKKLKDTRKACKKLWRAHKCYLDRVTFMKNLTELKEERDIEKAKMAEKLARDPILKAQKELVMKLKDRFNFEKKKFVPKYLDKGKYEMITDMRKKVDQEAKKEALQVSLKELPDDDLRKLKDDFEKDYCKHFDQQLEKREKERKEEEDRNRLRLTATQSMMVKSAEVAQQQAEKERQEREYQLQRKNSEAQKMYNRLDAKASDAREAKKVKQERKYREILQTTEHDVEYESDSDSDFIYDRELFINHSMSAEVFQKYIYLKNRKRKRTFWIEYDKSSETPDPLRLVWGKGKDKHVDFESIYLIAHGCYSPTFVKHEKKVDPKRVFSVCTKAKNGGGKILDLEAASDNVAELWVEGLRDLINQTEEQAEELSTNLRRNPPTVASKRSRQPPKWYTILDDDMKKQIKDAIGRAKRTSTKLETEIMDLTGCTRKDSQRLLRWWNDKGREKIQPKAIIEMQKNLFDIQRKAVWRQLRNDGYDTEKIEWDDIIMYEKVTKRDLHWKKWKEWIKKEALKMLDSLGEQPDNKKPEPDCKTQ